jgi:two-component system, sensor histidine kinase PdtaS
MAVSPTPRERVAGAFDRLATSYKLLILLSVSLLPIMLIALLASYQASHNAIEQHRQEYSALATDDATTLDRTFAVDQRLLMSALAALEKGADPAQICSRLREITRFRQVVRPFALFGANAQPVCASDGFVPKRPNQSMLQPLPLITVGENDLTVAIRSDASDLTGVIVYDRATLAALNRTMLRSPGVYDMSLVFGDQQLTVTGPHSRPLTSSVVGAAMSNGLVLQLTIASPGASASDWLLALLPILMWIAAAVVGFLVVDRALLRPLEELRARIANARGGIPEVPEINTPAHEIRDLAQALSDFAQDRSTHEGDIAAALNRQTALTREVHHRVKNNLQVIASLISLHARATHDRAALDAFAAIQRRVDALAIVHRNHYAQSDQQGALELKPVVNELVANLLTNIAGSRITAQVQPMRVSLDTATALTFLITEFVELSTLVDIGAPIAILVSEDGDQGRLAVEARALIAGEAFDVLIEERYGRILTGLVRQLRTTLHHDPVRGAYKVDFPRLPAV